MLNIFVSQIDTLRHKICKKFLFAFFFVIRLRDASGMPSGFLRLHNLFFFFSFVTDAAGQTSPGHPFAYGSH